MRFSLMLFILSFTSLFLAMNVVLAVPMSKSNCQETCGNNVTIPYPFGIGPNCTASSNFTVICRNVTVNGTSKPFLSSIDMEVLHFSVAGTVTVNHSVSPLDCSTVERTNSLGISLFGSPFYISSKYNSLANLGCINSVWLRPNATTTVGGCNAICDKNSSDTSCNGVNCCQSTVPSRLQELDLTHRSTQAGNENGTCGYAFLVDKKWFGEDYRRYSGLLKNLQNPFDLQFRFAPLVLEWESHSYLLQFSAYASCYSRDIDSYIYDSYYIPNVSDYGSTTTWCYCDQGFEGNPYLVNGCLDIDEYERGYCGNETCHNTIGHYFCGQDFIYSNPSTKRKTAIIGVGSGLGALLLLVGAWRGGIALRRRIKTLRKQKFFKRNGGLLLEKHISSINNGLEKTKLFSSKELAKATDRYNENRILGRGGQGTVYKGMLTDGKIVAIKKSKQVEEDDLEVFINEVVILSLINHRNVVKLLGCCLETEVPLLVYEFIPNGTLFQHLHDPNEEFPISWEMRVQIATDVAGALAYLHSSASTPIYHRDIKSTNILLDDKYRAKVADFGTSRSVAIDQTHATTRVLGTFGYLNPEYFQSNQFTEKSDVYSFGVVMVELLTGEKAITSIRDKDEGKSLATHFLNSMEENQLFDILDPRVLKEGKKEHIKIIGELAKRCLHLNGKKRPTMKEVASELESIKLRLKEGSDIEQSVPEDVEFHSINISETYDFSSISDRMHFDSITKDASDAHPLLPND